MTTNINEKRRSHNERMRNYFEKNPKAREKRKAYLKEMRERFAAEGKKSMTIFATTEQRKKILNILKKDEKKT